MTQKWEILVMSKIKCAWDSYVSQSTTLFACFDILFYVYKTINKSKYYLKVVLDYFVYQWNKLFLHVQRMFAFLYFVSEFLLDV